MKKNLLFGAMLWCLTFTALTERMAHARGFIPANDLDWPLRKGSDHTYPRAGIWTSLGELQRSGYKLHSGVDFRGVSDDNSSGVRDAVYSVSEGHVVWGSNIDWNNLEKCNSAIYETISNATPDVHYYGWSCRIYVKADDSADPRYDNHQYIYYYSHLYWGRDSDSGIFTRSAMEAAQLTGGPFTKLAELINALVQNYSSPGDETRIRKGALLATIANFGNDKYYATINEYEQEQLNPSQTFVPYLLVDDWPHLHFSIIDANRNFNAINPLTALKKQADYIREEMRDFESPEVKSISYWVDRGKSTSDVEIVPEGSFREISGVLDIAAEVKDTFNETPADIAITDISTVGAEIGIYKGEYRISKVNDNTFHPIEQIWFEFDEVPISCTGAPADRAACTPTTLDDFVENSIGSNSGAFGIGTSYQDVIYHSRAIGSSYSGPERNMPMLTNAWGEDGSWDTTRGPDGLYQVSVMIWDEEGNGASKSDFVYVNNNDNFITEADLPPGFYARDYVGHNGSVPSNLAGEAICRTPDIVIMDEGSSPPDPMQSPDFFGIAGILQAGKTYDIYVRVHHLTTFGPVSNVKAALTAYVASTIYNESIAEHITQDDAGNLVFQGDSEVSLNGSEKTLIGPFKWTPEHNGHMCLMAYITSDEDPYVSGMHVYESNKMIQRNIQMSGENYFYFGNPYSLETSDIKLAVTITGGGTVIMTVEADPSLDAWLNNIGPGYTVEKLDNGKMKITSQWGKFDLPPLTLSEGRMLRVDVEVFGEPGRWYNMEFTQYIETVYQGSVWIQLAGPPELD